jgi:mRNA interferase MazF
MITSAANRGWPGDVPVSELGQAGLPSESVVRTAKIATIESKEALRAGCLPADDRKAVLRALRENLASLDGLGY